MALAKRIIPTLLHKGPALVKGRGFASDRRVGVALQAALTHAKRGVDELVILNVQEPEDPSVVKKPAFELVEQLTAAATTPIAVGGGITFVEDVDHLFMAGADKVVLGRAATQLKWVSNIAKKFGSQAIVASLDVKDGSVVSGPAQKRHTHTPALWAQALELHGVGEILLQSVERDGTMEGYDLPLIEKVARAVTIPVIASGGCSGYEDMLNAFKAGASAVAAGALFQFTDATPRGAAEYLHLNGIEVRL